MLQVSHLTMTHKKDLRIILRDFSMVLNRGDKAVLIGEEGNGKSTLLKWIYDPALTEDYIDAEGTRTSNQEVLGYLPQELSEEDRHLTVYEYFQALDAFQEADPADLYRIAAGLHLTVEDFYRDQRMGSLSGGERVKVQMAGLLLKKPDILLLDEPSNDIDIDTLMWLEKMIADFTGAVLFISRKDCESGGAFRAAEAEDRAPRYRSQCAFHRLQR